jgi:pectin methylesterase-like acyl-CoA thioesterase
VLLVGDSTLASRTGYGDQLCGLFDRDITCVNLARGGRSTKSFRADGSWARVTALLAEPALPTYVLIQFGHNDQPGKAERTTDLQSEFPGNLARYVDEVRAAGATPVLGTPLTRRTFRGGSLDNDLEPWADAVRNVARERRVPLLDMNAESAAAVRHLGSPVADTLAMDPPGFDRTHLGTRGAAFFSRMAARQWAEGVPALARRFANLATRPQLSATQAAGYSYRDVLGSWDPVSESAAARSAGRVDFVVDSAAKPDGETRFATVQSAVQAAIVLARKSGRTERIHILLRPGVYRELVYIPASSAPITLFGDGIDPSAVRISATLDATTPADRYAAAFGAPFAGADPAIAEMFASIASRPVVGTSGSAIAWIRNAGFEAHNLTIENTYQKDRGNTSNFSQAVAALVDDADRAHFENVRFLGYQDTLYLRSVAPGPPARVFVRDSYVEGDVDFIFGEATAYFLRTEVKSLGDRDESYALAPSTHERSRFGFVFQDCRFTHDGSRHALAGRFKLARQWFRGGAREAVGKAVLLDSHIGAHIDKLRPWSDWGKPGSPRYRPVQYDSGEPAFEPWLAEFRSLDE